MITIISGTNRPDSNTRQVSDAVAETYRLSGAEQQVYDLIDVPRDIAFSEVFGNRSETFSDVIQHQVANVDKFVFVVPEYNGGFPGIVKLFVDAVEPNHWYGKKAALIGVSTGRSGNLRGLDHLAGVLNYLRVDVLHFKPALAHFPAPVPGGADIPEAYLELLEMQRDLFLEF